MMMKKLIVLIILLSTLNCVSIIDRIDNKTLESAVQFGDLRVVHHYIKWGHSVDQRNDKGNTLLMLAVESNREESINYLVRRGANINAQNKKGQTALMIAYIKNNQNIYDLLIKLGADEKIKDNHGLSIAEYKKEIERYRAIKEMAYYKR
jgi:ankyrin repeat protein